MIDIDELERLIKEWNEFGDSPEIGTFLAVNASSILAELKAGRELAEVAQELLDQHANKIRGKPYVYDRLQEKLTAFKESQ